MAYMVQSVELLLDATTEETITRNWARLIDAGLPSAGRHGSLSNRPHITVAVADSLTDEQEAGLTTAYVDLPIAVQLGGLLLFGSGPFVLARLVVPSAELIELHRSVNATMDDCDDRFPHQQPGSWTAHVTMARRLRMDQVAPALTALGPVEDLAASCISLRRWDGERKVEWPIEPNGDSDVEFAQHDR